MAHAQRSFVVAARDGFRLGQHDVRLRQGKKSRTQQKELDLFFHRDFSSSVSGLKLVDLGFYTEVNGTAITWVIQRRCVDTR